MPHADDAAAAVAAAALLLQTTLLLLGGWLLLLAAVNKVWPVQGRWRAGHGDFVSEVNDKVMFHALCALAAGWPALALTESLLPAVLLEGRSSSAQVVAVAVEAAAAAGIRVAAHTLMQVVTAKRL